MLIELRLHARNIMSLYMTKYNFGEIRWAFIVRPCLMFPEGAVLWRIELSQPLVVTLPTPSRAFFWFGKSMRSFQGPVTLPETGEDN